MQIERGTIWHTYTTQSPEYQDAETLASELISSGIYVAILTPNNIFKYLINDIPASTKLDMRYENNESAVSVTGGQEVFQAGACILTANAFSNCINIRLSENKLFHIADSNHSENIICCQKPIIIKKNNIDFFITPIIRLYKNGISHVTFIDIEMKNENLNDFIENVLYLPHSLNTSITTSIEFATSCINLDYSRMPIIQKLKAREIIRASLSKLDDNAGELEINGSILAGKYVDYANSLQIHHSLSDIARYIIAIIYSHAKKGKIADVILGRDTTKFYNPWQGKPNVYILEHSNQKDSSFENHSSNKKLISAILGKSHLFSNKKQTKEYIDHRAFDDYNFFSEQSIALTLLSSKANAILSTGTYTEENVMWDNQVKSDLREFISFFYESRIDKIKNEKTHLGLAKTQEEVIEFEEWVRILSKKYGEVQDFAFSTYTSSDIKKVRNNLGSMLKSRMLVIKLIDANFNESSNKKITTAFGLIASVSLSPVIIKPLSTSLGLTEKIHEHNLKNYEDAIYFIITILIIQLLIFLMNIRK